MRTRGLDKNGPSSAFSNSLLARLFCICFSTPQSCNHIAFSAHKVEHFAAHLSLSLLLSFSRTEPLTQTLIFTHIRNVMDIQSFLSSNNFCAQ